MNLTEIGGRIKAQRKNLGISQEKLAEMVNVSPHYIYEIERGTKSMSLETFVTLSQALNLTADFILFGSKTDSTFSLAEQLNRLDDERRTRAENAFIALLPFIN